MIEAIGYIAGLLLALCGLPQAIASYRSGHSRGITMAMVLMWFVGEVLILIYILAKPIHDLPLTLNYLSNLAIVGVILKFKLFERAYPPQPSTD